MDELANRNFRKSIKNYKNILNGAIIVIFTLIVGNALFSLFLTGSAGYTSLISYLFIDFIILLSFLLYSLMAKKISVQIMSRKLEDIFNLVRSLNYFSFIFIILTYFLLYASYFIKIIIVIVLIVECFKKYNKLKRRELGSKLHNFILLGMIFVVLGMIIPLFQIALHSTAGLLFGPVFVLIGMALMNNEAINYFTIQNLEILKNLQKSQQIINPSKISGQISENIAKQDPEKKVIKAEIKPNFIKQPEIATREEILSQTSETPVVKAEIKSILANQSEIAIKGVILPQSYETTVIKAEPKSELVKQTRITPEEEITPKKMKTKKSGLFSFKFDRKKVLKKPIRSKLIKKEEKPLVPKKKCSFCGKEHEDLNAPFCYVCGFKF